MSSALHHQLMNQYSERSSSDILFEFILYEAAAARYTYTTTYVLSAEAGSLVQSCFLVTGEMAKITRTCCHRLVLYRCLQIADQFSRLFTDAAAFADFAALFHFSSASFYSPPAPMLPHTAGSLDSVFFCLFISLSLIVRCKTLPL